METAKEAEGVKMLELRILNFSEEDCWSSQRDETSRDIEASDPQLCYRSSHSDAKIFLRFPKLSASASRMTLFGSRSGDKYGRLGRK